MRSRPSVLPTVSLSLGPAPFRTVSSTSNRFTSWCSHLLSTISVLTQSQSHFCPTFFFKGPASELFGFIADCVKEFLTELGHDLNDDEKLHLGFTFSFPAHQTALDKGTLISWTKVNLTSHLPFIFIHDDDDVHLLRALPQLTQF